MIKNLVNALLTHPNLKSVDMDSEDRLDLHRQVLEKKPVLQHVFTEMHLEMLALEKRYVTATTGARIELGAGVYPLKRTDKEILATDVVNAPHLDGVLDAQAMDVSSYSVRTLFGQNCFHHFPRPRAFFSEASRVLLPGGGVILIEPYHGPIASFCYKRLFPSEIFDPQVTDWERDQESGPMTGANQALSYMVFKRDIKKFSAEYPRLELCYSGTLPNYLRYLLSGGLNFRSLIPNAFEGLLCRLERMLRPAEKWLALHHILVVRARE